MSTLAKGSVIAGRYRLVRPLAQGGMGAVWRAHHEHLDIPIAVKLMAPALAASEDARARFEREAKAAARLSSPHVVQVHDYGLDRGVPYMVMELCEGEDLSDRLRRARRVPLGEAWTIASQIGKALALAHEAGVVHRDLKPSNVFLARVGDDEVVKVLDFGIAKWRAAGTRGAATAPGALLGSPDYMSPEQARGEAELDHRSDLWSLGVILFQCLTGGLPFAAGDVAALIGAICGAPIPLATSRAPDLPPAVDRFFDRALARGLGARFQSAREMVRAFAAIVEQAGEPAPGRMSIPPPAPERARDEDAIDPDVPRNAKPTTPIARVGSRRVERASSEAPTHRDLPEGEQHVIADRFEIQTLVGQGGMGSVYRARDRVTRAVLALKIVRGGDVDRERFFREAKILANLFHPGIVRYHAHGVTPQGQLYLAMDWLEGPDLATVLARGKLGLAESLALCARVAEALGAAHRRGVVHRDVKPGNIVLVSGSAEQVKLLDFGIARTGTAARDGDARPERAIGTLGYMAPEQMLSRPDIDPRADVFALGCVLFECLTGRPAFEAETEVGLLARMMSPPPSARAHVPSLPEAVDHLIARLVAAAPESRPADGQAAAEAILACAPPVPSRSSSRPGPRESLSDAEQRLAPLLSIVPRAVLDAGLSATEPGGPSAPRDFGGEEPTLAADAASIALSARVSPIARRFRATTEVLPNGTIAVLLDGGGPVVDQAARAALCALALREALTEEAIAIATGRRGTAGSSAAEVVSRALRALSAAPIEGCASRIVLDDATSGLLDGRFELARAGSASVLAGPLRAEPEEPKLLGKATVCAGREAELAMLAALYRECAEEGAAKAAILEGPAGSGKTRVRIELLRRLAQSGERFETWIGRGDVMSAGSPFGILTRALHAALGLTGGEPELDRRARLAEAVAASVPAADAPRVALFLGDMMGIAPDGALAAELVAAREDALLLGDQRRRAFEDFAAARSADRPLVLVLEDLQWGDLPTVKLLDGALRTLARSSFFVLCTARPEISDLFPRLWEDRSPQRIRVGPLSPKAGEKIVRHVLGANAEPDLIARIVARAAGHPLHLEEILRVVSEGRGDELPDTALALVEARLFALDPQARRVLRAGSVLGRVFWESAVVSLTGERPADVREWLTDLALREWLTKSARSRFPGETEYSFAQDLTQEAAYATLPDPERALGHRLAGAWLEAAGERDPALLARHFELGGDADQAAGHLVAAAEQALDAGDFAAVIALADRIAAAGADAQLLARARALQAEAHLHRGDVEAARARGFEAPKLLPPDDPASFRALAAAIVAAGKMGDVAAIQTAARGLLALGDRDRPVDGAASSPVPRAFSERPVHAHSFAIAASPAVVHLVIGGDLALAGQVFERLESVVRSMPRPEPAARALLARAAGARAAFTGDLFGSIVHLREAAAAFEELGDLRSLCSTRKTLGWYLGECGALEEAESSLRESLATAEKMGLENLAPHAKHDLGSPLLRLRKLAEARRFQEEAAAAFRAQGDRRLESSAHALLSAIASAEGDFDDAERKARIAIDLSTSGPIRFAGLAYLARALLGKGLPEDAIRSADEALAILRETGSIEEGLAVCQLTRAEALLSLGRTDEAREQLRRAKEEIEKRAEQIRDADLRRAFLQRIPENARVLELAAETGG
jgi:serine/threonine protein kinase/tetratricopeptide (TPR) repeat protein